MYNYDNAGLLCGDSATPTLLTIMTTRQVNVDKFTTINNSIASVHTVTTKDSPVFFAKHNILCGAQHPLCRRVLHICPAHCAL
jgi:hypothetical protein